MDFESLKNKDAIVHRPFEVNPKLVEQIEKFEILSKIDRAYMLLVLAGAKPAAHIGLIQNSRETVEAYTEKANQVRELIKKTELFWEEEAEKASGSELLVNYFIVSRDSGIAKEAFLYLHGDDKNIENTRRFGLLMGYPKTAVENYVQKVHLPEDFSQTELPEDVEFAEYMSFSHFRLSQDHWQEELETVKQWAKTIRGIAPNLYREIVSIRKGFELLRKEHPEEFMAQLNSDKHMRFIKFRDPELYEELIKEKKSRQ